MSYSREGLKGPQVNTLLLQVEWRTPTTPSSVACRLLSSPSHLRESPLLLVSPSHSRARVSSVVQGRTKGATRASRVVIRVTPVSQICQCLDLSPRVHSAQPKLLPTPVGRVPKLCPQVASPWMTSTEDLTPERMYPPRR